MLTVRVADDVLQFFVDEATAIACAQMMILSCDAGVHPTVRRGFGANSKNGPSRTWARQLACCHESIWFQCFMDSATLTFWSPNAQSYREHKTRQAARGASS